MGNSANGAKLKVSDSGMDAQRLRTATLLTAIDIINGDRNESYGDAAGSFYRIANVWSHLTGYSITPEQVAIMMAGLKLCRLSVSPNHRDSWVDLAGYAGLGSEIAEGRNGF
jgi:hypothetical protein